jgi:RHS repeat-associated protein
VFVYETSSETDSYTYDGAGKRVERTVNGTTYDYAYDVQGYATKGSAGFGGWDWSEFYLGGMHAGTYVNGSTYFSHNDLLGSERMETDPNGNTNGSAETNLPFGEWTSTGMQSELGFTGDLLDSLDGNVFHTPFRQLSQTQGRWMIPDPAGLAAVNPWNPQTWNRYAYVGNNPVTFNDPLGLVDADPGSEPTGCHQDDDCPVGGSGSPGGGNDGGFPGGGNSCSVFGLCAGGGLPRLPPGLGPCVYVLKVPCGQAPGSSPKDAVPTNPCTQAGGAPDPTWYVAQVQQAGQLMRASTMDSGASLINQLNQFITLSNFQRGGYLDAQPLGASPAYGNYVFGAALNAAGYSLPFTLSAANDYAFLSGAQYPGKAMDPNYGSIPAANVANITNGYNAQQNGTVCSTAPTPASPGT